MNNFLFMGILSFLFGCKASESKKQTVEVDGKKIETVKSENPMSPKYKLTDLTLDQTNHNKSSLIKFEMINSKYGNKNKTFESQFDAENIDFILEEWKKDKSNNRVDQNQLIDILGSAFGQNIVDDLNFEWKIWTDEYGSDITIIDKKIVLNGFPFSSVYKAIDQNRVGSLNDIKLLLKKNLEDANAGKADYQIRN